VTEVKIIKSEVEYERSLVHLYSLMDALPGTPEVDELELLSVLIEHYENEHYPIASETCKWSPNRDLWGTDYWDTSCDYAWEMDGTPADNHMVYCPFCGRKLEVAE
jgi:hypothetical protein